MVDQQMPVPSVPLQDQKKGGSARMVVYGILGFILGAALGGLAPLISYLPVQVGSFGFLLSGVLLAVIGILCGYYLDKIIKPVHLTPARKLLGMSFSYYSSHLPIILSIWVVPTLFSFVGLVIPLISPSVGITVLLTVILTLAAIIINFLAFISTIWVVTRPSGEVVTMGGAYRAGLQSFFSVLWVWFLSIVAIMGAYIASMIAIVVVYGIVLITIGILISISNPGAALAGLSGIAIFLPFIFYTAVAIYISQGLYVRFADEKKGLAALAQSWMYVHGKAGAVLWRWAVLAFCMMIPFILLMFLVVFTGPNPTKLSSAQLAGFEAIQTSSPAQMAVSVCLTLFLNFFFSPFSLLYGAFLFGSLKEAYTPPMDAENVVQKKRTLLKILSWFGGVGTVLGFIFLLISIAGIVALLSSKNAFSSLHNLQTTSPSSVTQ